MNSNVPGCPDEKLASLMQHESGVGNDDNAR